MDINTRIRAAAHMRVRVYITKRTRSKTGFIVSAPGQELERFRTKKAALSNLLTKIRCTPRQDFIVSQAPTPPKLHEHTNA